MFVRNVYVEKHKVTVCPSSSTAKEALEVIQKLKDKITKSGFRVLHVEKIEKAG